MLGFNSDHPRMKDVPIGLHARGIRRESGSLGGVEVHADKTIRGKLDGHSPLHARQTGSASQRRRPARPAPARL